MKNLKEEFIKNIYNALLNDINDGREAFKNNSFEQMNAIIPIYDALYNTNSFDSILEDIKDDDAYYFFQSHYRIDEHDAIIGKLTIMPEFSKEYEYNIIFFTPCCDDSNIFNFVVQKNYYYSRFNFHNDTKIEEYKSKINEILNR